MMLEVAFDSVPTMSVVDGSSGRANLPSVAAAAAQNTAARNAKRTLGYSIVR